MTSRKSAGPGAIEATLGVHLNIPKQIAQGVWRARRHTKQYFESQEFEPHITVYLTRLTGPSYRQLVLNLRRKSFRAVRMSFLPLRIAPLPDGRIFISLPARRTPTLTGLHRLVVNTTQPLRHGLLRQKDVTRLKLGYYSPAAARCTKKYGYQFVMDRYNPHITIGTVAGAAELKSAWPKIMKELKPLYQRTWILNELVAGLYNYHQGLDKYIGQPAEKLIMLRE